MKILIVALLLVSGIRAQAAQQWPAPAPQPILLAQADLPSLPADLAPQGPVAAAQGIPGWHQLHTFGGAAGHWKLGLDASSTAGACVERELHDGQWLAGPCRDVLLLAKDSKVAFHLGGAVMSNAEHFNTTFQLRMGLNLGPVVKAGLDRIPALDSLANLNPPPWVSKLGNATTLDFAGGYRPHHTADVYGNWTYGVAVKVDVPLDAAFGWLKTGL